MPQQKTDQCPNCDQPLGDENYCSNCGQKNNVQRLTLWHMVRESLSNFFSFDGRFFRTLYQLFRYPGKVPHDYMLGKRMRYMHPIRIYFLSSLLMLFIIRIQKEEPHSVPVNESPTADHTPGQSEPVEARSDSLTTEYEPPTQLPVNLEVDSEKMPVFFEQLVEMSDFAKDHPTLSSAEALDSLGQVSNWWHQFMYTQAVKASRFDQETFNSTVISKLFWILFLFVPVLGILLKLLYVRRPYFYPEHLFFGFYNQSVFFLLTGLGMMLKISSSGFWGILLLYSIYLFIAMKRFYQQGFFKTLLKFGIINILGLVSFILFFLLAALTVFIIF